MSTLEISGNGKADLATPFIPVTDVSLSAGSLVGEIYWIPVGTAWALTAGVALPDGQMMVMVERVVDATQAIDDIRFIASIANGQLTINGVFDKSGNYVITPERINRGLARINAPFRLAFDKIEFDAYVEIS
jgi:hypothetical protein